MAEAPKEGRPSTPTEGPKAAGATTYRQMPVLDVVIPIFYAILILVIVLLLPRLVTNHAAVELLTALMVLYLARQLSIFYSIDEDHLNAWRLFGWRRVPLTSIRRIEESSLRELSPTGLFGTWGWRSRLWSPQVGKLEVIHTYHRGLLVFTDEVPLFISPKDRESFASELTRRVEAAGGTLEAMEPGA